MSDFKLILENSYRQTKDVTLDESLNDKEAVLEINLDHFNAGQGFQEAVTWTQIAEFQWPLPVPSRL